MIVEWGKNPLPHKKFNKIERIAAERHRIHALHASSRPLSMDYELVGLIGECCFGAVVGLEPDLSIRPAGDNGIDFTTNIFTIDVKTSQKKPRYLPVEPSKINADIYVQAWADMDERRCHIFGWMFAKDIVKYDVGDLGYGIPSHLVPVGDLRPIEELTAILFFLQNPPQNNNGLKLVKGLRP